MNTSDQNVFTLDTAFQRRFSMQLIENSFENVDDDFKNMKILDTDITWQKFCTTINEKIAQNNEGLSSMEDKRFGVYFVNIDDLKSKENFAIKSSNTFGMMSLNLIEISYLILQNLIRLKLL